MVLFEIPENEHLPVLSHEPLGFRYVLIYFWLVPALKLFLRFSLVRVVWGLPTVTEKIRCDDNSPLRLRTSRCGERGPTKCRNTPEHAFQSVSSGDDYYDASNEVSSSAVPSNFLVCLIIILELRRKFTSFYFLFP